MQRYHTVEWFCKRSEQLIRWWSGVLAFNSHHIMVRGKWTMQSRSLLCINEWLSTSHENSAQSVLNLIVNGARAYFENGQEFLSTRFYDLPMPSRGVPNIRCPKCHSMKSLGLLVSTTVLWASAVPPVLIPSATTLFNHSHCRSYVATRQVNTCCRPQNARAATPWPRPDLR